MKNKLNIDFSHAISSLIAGGIGIIPTDTLYGIVASAKNEKAVERIYAVRNRDLNKPMIILISSFEDLLEFGIELDKKTKDILKKYWPGKISFIFLTSSEKFQYLHRGTNSLAFRMPKEKWLLDVIKKTGPLVAPSANIAGFMPAINIDEAKKYFKNKIDFYVDFGTLKSEPSTIVQINKDNLVLIRKGAVEFENNKKKYEKP